MNGYKTPAYDDQKPKWQGYVERRWSKLTNSSGSTVNVIVYILLAASCAVFLFEFVALSQLNIVTYNSLRPS